MTPVQVQVYVCESCNLTFTRQKPTEPPRSGNIWGYSDSSGQWQMVRGGEREVPTCQFCSGQLVPGGVKYAQVDVPSDGVATSDRFEAGGGIEWRLQRTDESQRTDYRPQDRLLWQRMLERHGLNGPQMYPFWRGR